MDKPNESIMKGLGHVFGSSGVCVGREGHQSPHCLLSRDYFHPEGSCHCPRSKGTFSKFINSLC